MLLKVSRGRFLEFCLALTALNLILIFSFVVRHQGSNREEAVQRLEGVQEGTQERVQRSNGVKSKEQTVHIFEVFQGNEGKFHKLGSRENIVQDSEFTSGREDENNAFQGSVQMIQGVQDNEILHDDEERLQYDGELLDSFQQQLDLVRHSSSFDKSRQFKTKSFLFIGDDWNSLSTSRRVCLGTQTSLDRLSWLLDSAEVWSGPISVALFAPDVEFHLALEFIDYVRRCDDRIRRQVSFHMTYPVDHGVSEIIGLERIQYGCEENPRAVLERLLAMRPGAMLQWRETMAYPQNLLRNVAKSGCQTNFTFVPDIDMIPNVGLDLELEGFLGSRAVEACEKCAYVVPTYEISDSSSHLPRNKSELENFVRSKQARQFHQAVFKINQKSSELERWLGIPQANSLGMAYRVEKYVFRYEPLYVSRGDVPQFDERFVGFGLTRNTQVYEMYVAGYSFYLLNNAFTSHWGFQTMDSRPFWRAAQQESNNRLFDDFARELIAKYGRDPYNMMAKLKGLNLKHAKVAFGKPGFKAR